MEIGYALSSEEHEPLNLVKDARQAEDAGFTFALISDHFHPWIDAQGQSPFVWSVLGGIAQATERMRVGTGVTCPTVRIHPAVIAQATATTQCMFDGRFWFGVGSGEALNEHILATKWPEASVRLEMLEEAIAMIRELWTGGRSATRGRHYRVENAPDLHAPDDPIEIFLAAAAPALRSLRADRATVSSRPRRTRRSCPRTATRAGRVRRSVS